MRVAVVGSGVSGLVTAHLLAREHEVTVFERRDRLGGHTHTVDVEVGDERQAVDAGGDRLAYHGVMLLQAITVQDRDFESPRRRHPGSVGVGFP